ncbi:MAG TPA: hydrogenase, partial [Verrucomicrobiales bacterium]|nr:hydrogenase [Verrucomicrobiales bacterium]
ADHRLRVPSSQIIKVAAEIARMVLSGSGVSGSQVGELLTGVNNLGRGLSAETANPDWIRGCADDLIAHKGAAVVLAGYQQPVEMHLIAHALNVALGGLDKTFDLMPAPDRGEGTLAELGQLLDAGSVDTLVIVGSNPVYSAPADLRWEFAQGKARQVVRLGYHEDETAEATTLHYPLAHYLESWGDARTSDGVYVPVQPLVQPLFGGITALEFLARIGGLPSSNPYDIVRNTFGTFFGGTFSENSWRQFLHDGFLAESAFKPVEGSLNWAAVAAAVSRVVPVAAPTKDNVELVFARDLRVDDGRHANNGWLQELPDPVTKVAWENVIAMSKATARELGVFPKYWDDTAWLKQYSNLLAEGKTFAPLVRLSLEGKEVVGPLWIQPGLADNTVVVQLGYGRPKAGRVGDGAGYDAYTLRDSSSLWTASGVKVTPERDLYLIACTQTHWKMEGRPIVREANLDQFKAHPGFATAMNGHEMPGGNQTLYPNPLDELRKNPNVVHQWGMAIDLNACTGCSACVIACQSENNIPIVGKEQMSRSREMHWLRIDRYFAGDFADPQMVNQPMLCQHCEAAPCESVCPVNATVHDEEGLNVMAYNRCVGTRYCSNNCPYKVRRYNFFDYHKRSLKDLTGPVYSTPMTSSTDGEWDLARWWKDPANNTKRPTDEWELLKLVKNPDVSVRMRGVMEKCT